MGLLIGPALRRPAEDERSLFHQAKSLKLERLLASGSDRATYRESDPRTAKGQGSWRNAGGAIQAVNAHQLAVNQFADSDAPRAHADGMFRITIIGGAVGGAAALYYLDSELMRVSPRSPSLEKSLGERSSDGSKPAA